MCAVSSSVLLVIKRVRLENAKERVSAQQEVRPSRSAALFRSAPPACKPSCRA